MLKSYKIDSALGRQQGHKLMEEMLDKLLKHFEVTVYYTTIPSTKIPQVKKYGYYKSAVVQVPTIEFLKSLDGPYPHCCAWKYIMDNPGSLAFPILLDYFEGELTQAWEDVGHLPNVKVCFGDDCNCFVSMADIMTKIIDNRIFLNKKKLYLSDIEECFQDISVKPVFIDELSYIVPKTNVPIDISLNAIHPLVFVLKEGIHQEVLGSTAKEHDMIETSPAMERILNFAFSINGGYKFFDAKHDPGLIRPNDYFVYFGKKGQETAEYLSNLGYQINIRGIKEIEPSTKEIQE